MSSSKVSADGAFARRLRRAEGRLAAGDAALGALIERHGPLDPARYERRTPFEALAFAIVGQQLSTRAAAGIAARVAQLCGGRLDAEPLATLTPEALRGAGLSGAKARSLATVSDAVAGGTLDLAALARRRDANVISQALCALPGIGPWTAHMFLMFGLRRLDVFAPGDLGLRKAIQALDALPALPAPEVCAARAEVWRPYQTVACWHLWRSLAATPALSAPPA